MCCYGVVLLSLILNKLIMPLLMDSTGVIAACLELMMVMAMMVVMVVLASTKS